MAVWWLIGSVVALLAGLAVQAFARHRPALLATTDTFVVISLVSLLALHVLPEAVREAGLWAIGAALLGLALPYFLEWPSGNEDAPHAPARGVQLLAACALLLHALLDGSVLATGDAHLPVAVIAHRLPVGMALWLLAPAHARGRWLATLGGAVVLATIAGFAAGRGLWSVVPPEFAAVGQALVAGSLLHVVLEHPAGSKTGPIPIASGSVLGVGALILSADSHEREDLLAQASRLLDQLVILSPALLLGYSAAALGHGFMQSQWIRRARDSWRILFAQPVSVCSVRDAYQSAVTRGASWSTAALLLVGLPVLALPALAVSGALFGATATALRVLLGLALVLAAVLALRLSVGAVKPKVVVPPEDQRGVAAAARDGLRFGFVDLLDHTAPWLFLGLLIAGALPSVPFEHWLAPLSEPMQVVLAASLAVPVYLCATGLTPAVASMLALGLSPGAAVAMLALGPATSFATLSQLRRLHGLQAALLMVAALWLSAVVGGWVVDALRFTVPRPTLRPFVAGWVALAVLALPLIASFLRLGPRGGMAVIFGLHGSVSHSHGDGHVHRPFHE